MDCYKNSVVSFTKNCTDYEEGFGDLNTEFWYGLDNVYFLTQTDQWEMRVDYQKDDKTWHYLHYNQFRVGNASEEYPLTVGGFTGVGTDLFEREPHNGMKFSTPDNDNDNWRGNCAAYYKSRVGGGTIGVTKSTSINNRLVLIVMYCSVR